jgi:NADH-quinone oxidoreductase subunit N
LTTLIILTALGLVCLFSEIFGFKKYLHGIVLSGLAVAVYTTIKDWNTDQSYFNDMIRMDNFALAFTALLILLTFLWLVMSSGFFEENSSKADRYSLIIFSLIGAQLMASFSNMLILFLGIEILSICLYVLAGSNKTDLNSNEASLKYFLLGAFATGFLLLGMTFIYGAAGSFHTQIISGYFIAESSAPSGLALAGILLMFTAMAFKVSAVPFHFWVPDVYHGSPTYVTTFMASVVKTAAFAALFRVFQDCFQSVSNTWETTIWIVAAATIILGNITAVYQNNFKRLLAYSSIAHAGYMLLSVLAITPSSASSLFFYTTAYGVSSIAAFAILILISRSSGNETIDSFRGLAKNNPLLAATTIVAMLSLAGIPPLAGFFGKYYIFSATIQAGYTGLVVIAIIGSLIGVFYYFKVIIALFDSDVESPVIQIDRTYTAVLLVTSIASLVLGLAPGLLAGIL